MVLMANMIPRTPNQRVPDTLAALPSFAAQDPLQPDVGEKPAAKRSRSNMQPAFSLVMILEKCAALC